MGSQLLLKNSIDIIIHKRVSYWERTILGVEKLLIIETSEFDVTENNHQNCSVFFSLEFTVWICYCVAGMIKRRVSEGEPETSSAKLNLWNNKHAVSCDLLYTFVCYLQDFQKKREFRSLVQSSCNYDCLVVYVYIFVIDGNIKTNCGQGEPIIIKRVCRPTIIKVTTSVQLCCSKRLQKCRI